MKWHENERLWTEGNLNHNAVSYKHQQMSLVSQFTAPSLTYAPYSLCLLGRATITEEDI